MKTYAIMSILVLLTATVAIGTSFAETPKFVQKLPPVDPMKLKTPGQKPAAPSAGQQDKENLKAQGAYQFKKLGQASGVVAKQATQASNAQQSKQASNAQQATQAKQAHEDQPVHKSAKLTIPKLPSPTKPIPKLP